MTTTGKTSAGTINSYPSHKTISLVEEKAIANKEATPLVPKENKPVVEPKPVVKEQAKASYPAHKTISLGTEQSTVIPEVKKDEPVKQAITGVLNKLDSPISNLNTKEVVQKTTDLIKEQPLVQKIEDTVQKTTNSIKEQAIVQKVAITEKVNTSYPAHKTVSLGSEQSTVVSEVKKDEPVKQVITGALNKLDSPISDLNPKNLVQKSTDLIKEQPIVQKLEDTVQKTSDFIKVPPVIQKTEELSQKTSDLVKEQVELPKFEDATQKISNFAKEQPVTQKVDDNLQKASNFIKDQPVIQKAETIINTDKPVTTAINQISGNKSYPAHKTITLEQSSEKKESIPPVIPVKEEIKPPIKIQEPTVTSENKAEPVASVNTTIPQGAYLAHKTHYFVKEEGVNPIVQDIKPKVLPSDSNEGVSAETKQATVKTTPAIVPAAKTKKPIVWIAASAALLITSAGTAWYAYQQKQKMESEIVALKQSNEALAESVKKLQKDLHFDDIIARAGKLDAKNNITVIEDANASEILRTCFSITPNAQAKRGKKLVYIRFLNATGNVLVNDKNGEFEYKGNKVPYSAKEEIDYKGGEMMLCVDFKPAEKLQKGTYKAEIYNEGVLDGTSTFELK